MTKPYTKKGDKGKTTICGLAVEKNHPRLVILGALDELGSILGVALALSKTEGLAFAPKLKILSEIQADLMEIGAEISVKGRKVGEKLEKRTEILEKEIDKFWKDLPPLRNFILPGGGKAGSLLHLARAVCRRAEREIAALLQKEKIPLEILTYLNRLSDFLFALARWVNQKEGHKEKIWP